MEPYCSYGFVFLILLLQKLAYRYINVYHISHLTKHINHKQHLHLKEMTCSFPRILFGLHPTGPMKPHISRCGLTIPSLCLQLATDTFGTGLQGLCRSLTMKTHLKKRVLVGLAKPCIQIYIYKYHVTCVCVCVHMCQHMGCVLLGEK